MWCPREVAKPSRVSRTTLRKSLRHPPCGQALILDSCSMLSLVLGYQSVLWICNVGRLPDPYARTIPNLPEMIGGYRSPRRFYIMNLTNLAKWHDEGCLVAYLIKQPSIYFGHCTGYPIGSLSDRNGLHCNPTSYGPNSVGLVVDSICHSLGTTPEYLRTVVLDI